MIFSYLLNMQSHPSWVCGLKLYLAQRKAAGASVTPFVGVWIETELGKFLIKALTGHTLRGCVD